VVTTIERRLAEIMKGGIASILLTDGYKYTMASAGFPLRREVFYLSFRRGDPLYNPFHLDHVVQALSEIGLLRPPENDFLPSTGFDWTLAMEEALVEGVRVDAIPKGAWVGPREPILHVSGPSFAASWLEPLVIALHFPLQLATALKNGQRMFEFTCRDERRILEVTLEAMDIAPAKVTSEIRPLVHLAEVKARGLAVEHALGGDLSRASEVGMRGMTCLEQHRVSLEVLRGLGLTSTSNAYLARRLGLKLVGTCGHEHQMRHGPGDIAGFRALRDSLPGVPFYLPDTFDIDHQGIPAAVQVIQEAPDQRHGIRFDCTNQKRRLVTAYDMLRKNASPVHYGFMGDYDAKRVGEMEEFAVGLGVPPSCQSYGIGTYFGAVDAVHPFSRGRISMVYKLCETGGEPVMKHAGPKSTWCGKTQVWTHEGRPGQRRIMLASEDPSTDWTLWKPLSATDPPPHGDLMVSDLLRRNGDDHYDAWHRYNLLRNTV